MTRATDAIETLTELLPDWPQPGILFRDLSPVFADAEALRAVAEALVADFGEVEAIVGIEARGFVLATAAAVATGHGTVLIRKGGKTPPPVISRDYGLEYGEASLELAPARIRPGMRVVVVDDVLATGGTLAAGLELLREAGAEIVGIGVAIELVALEGRAKLGEVPITALQQV
ncbi:adenine phosphoribosyltransferase [Homoserinibacter sp. YIM 151385]|uniref:adenine phosphoribosyltransferase n=1 Tax=Homoserinibacter sp. YIM 151385 TaxID=2985506 RepID=UPI0022F13ECB|nr:adenine phosphoribosyltransferase [Homoserinibacter sp. YIM 151385]WBU38056.1 adenine phosphoribosyltransferase [Homoserinibacter sp. YIM 151385]